MSLFAIIADVKPDSKVITTFVRGERIALSLDVWIGDAKGAQLG